VGGRTSTPREVALTRVGEIHVGMGGGDVGYIESTALDMAVSLLLLLLMLSVAAALVSVQCESPV